MKNKMVKIILCTFLTGITLVPIIGCVNSNVNNSASTPLSLEDPGQMR